jgi:hypothetical protein
MGWSLLKNFWPANNRMLKTGDKKAGKTPQRSYLHLLEDEQVDSILSRIVLQVPIWGKQI